MKKQIRINLTKPNIDNREIDAAKKVLKSGWLIRGMQTKLLEEEFAKFSGAKYAIATNGCTMALYLAIKRLNLKKSDEVIVPSLTWTATAAAVIHAGGTPVFADVKKDTWCLDPEDVKQKITKNTKLVIPVHFASVYAEGFKKFPVPVLFDSAHRIEKNGFDGTESCHSFYAVKNMTTIRGGMLLTNNEEDAKWYMMAVHGGVAKDTLSRYLGAQKQNDASSFYYDVEIPLWNFDMTDVEAAIGRVQLKKLESLNAKRNKIVTVYNRAFGLKNKGNHMYPILVRNRDKFLIAMKKAGIHCGIHYLPLHLMKGYKQYYKGSLPNTEFIGKHCVTIPLYPDLTKKEIEFIVQEVNRNGKIIKEF